MSEELVRGLIEVRRYLKRMGFIHTEVECRAVDGAIAALTARQPCEHVWGSARMKSAEAGATIVVKGCINCGAPDRRKGPVDRRQSAYGCADMQRVNGWYRRKLETETGRRADDRARWEGKSTAARETEQEPLPPQQTEHVTELRKLQQELIASAHAMRAQANQAGKFVIALEALLKAAFVPELDRHLTERGQS